MATHKRSQLGALTPRYKFMLNPYPDERIRRCPLCEQTSRQRKLPLLIHIDPDAMFVLNYTCRYCPACDLLVAHKHEIEELLTLMFQRNDPSVIGNDYQIIGTVEKSAWREGMAQRRTSGFMLAHASDFTAYYQELRMTQPGWYHASQEPPIMEPPPSKKWVKQRWGIFRRK